MAAWLRRHAPIRVVALVWWTFMALYSAWLVSMVVQVAVHPSWPALAIGAVVSYFIGSVVLPEWRHIGLMWGMLVHPDRVPEPADHEGAPRPTA